LSFHCVREAIASGIMYLHKIGTKLNSSDIVNKHTGFVDAWPILCPLMFWKGLDDGNRLRNPSLRTNGEYIDRSNCEPRSATSGKNKDKKSFVLIPYAMKIDQIVRPNLERSRTRKVCLCNGL
jgi:hypothetical protein